MNKELSTDKTMTIKEVSEILGVTERTVSRHAEQLGLTKNGVKTFLNEEAVTIIKKKIELSGRNDLDNVVKLPKTDLEKKLLIKQGYDLLMGEVETLRAENSIIKSQRDRLIHSNKTFTASQIAKELNLKSATELNKILESKGVQFKQNNTWLLYSQYAGKGFTEIKEEEKNGTVIYYRRWTGLGRDWILGMISDTKDIIEECRR